MFFCNRVHQLAVTYFSMFDIEPINYFEVKITQ